MKEIWLFDTEHQNEREMEMEKETEKSGEWSS